MAKTVAETPQNWAGDVLASVRVWDRDFQNNRDCKYIGILISCRLNDNFVLHVFYSTKWAQVAIEGLVGFPI